MLDITVQPGRRIYKSPQRKLVRFFETSRNQWKSKCKGGKKVIKRLKNRIKFLGDSKGKLKKRVKALEAELKQIKASKRDDELKKVECQMAEDTKPEGYLKPFDCVPPYHSYSIGHITLFILLVISSAACLRGSSRCLAIVFSFLQFEFPIPSWMSGRLWLLRLGYYKLMEAKEKADDWAWIVDHTVQVGAEKCLVILGIRLCDLPAAGSCLGHEDVEVINLIPVKHSNGEVVYQQLQETVEKTGVPREIIGDHGSDLKAGVEKFCKEHEQTCYVYDIKHKGAAIVKQELKDDATWAQFCQLASKTKQKVQQTSLAPLGPPNQRTKSRYMNIDTLIEWG